MKYDLGKEAGGRVEEVVIEREAGATPTLYTLLHPVQSWSDERIRVVGYILRNVRADDK